MKSYTELIRHRGNEPLFQTIEMSLLSVLQGKPLHIHAEGLRGTGKTTIIRAIRELLPWIERLKGCLYNCDPREPHCPDHASLEEDELESYPTEWIPVPFLEVSHSAKIGTVVGSIDLGRLTDRTDPRAALLPGTLAQAHRGIVFIDEINRLADTSPELADVLLDVMGTKPGRLQIEEAGIHRVEMVSRVAVWAASNPDEEPGPLEDIRRQLADRFDLVAGLGRPEEVGKVRAILSQNLMNRWERACERVVKPSAATSRWRTAMALKGARALKPFPEGLTYLLAEIYTRFALESLRAVESLQLGSRMMSLLNDRDEVDIGDLIAVAPLALRHRVDLETLGEISSFLEQARHADTGKVGTALGFADNGYHGGGHGTPPGTGDKKRAPEVAGKADDELPSSRPQGGWLASLRDRLLSSPGEVCEPRRASQTGSAGGVGAGKRLPGSGAGSWPGSNRLGSNRLTQPGRGAPGESGRGRGGKPVPVNSGTWEPADPLSLKPVPPPNPATRIIRLREDQLVLGEEALSHG